MHKDTTSSFKPILNKLVCFWKILQEIFILDIIHLDLQMLVSLNEIFSERHSRDTQHMRDSCCAQLVFPLQREHPELNPLLSTLPSVFFFFFYPFGFSPNFSFFLFQGERKSESKGEPLTRRYKAYTDHSLDQEMPLEANHSYADDTAKSL